MMQERGGVMGGSVRGAILGLLLWALALSLGCSHQEAPEPIRIGQIYDSEQAQEGLQLALVEVNQGDNRVAGRTVEAHQVPTGDKGEAVSPIAIRLATIQKVSALLLDTEADQAEGLGVVAQDYHMPLIVPGYLTGRPIGDYVFHTGLEPSHQGEVLARFAAQPPLKAGNIAVVLAGADNTRAAGGPTEGTARGPRTTGLYRAVAEAFSNEVRKAGGKLAGEWTYQGPADLEQVMNQVKDASPDALLFAGPGADLTALSKAEFDPKLPVLFGGETGDHRAPPIGQLGNPFYLATVFVADNGNPLSQEFAKKYQARFHKRPDERAALAYDDARLLFEAMRQAKTAEGPKVRDQLAGIKDFNSLTGPLSFKGQWAARPVFIVRLEKGQTATVKRFEP